MSEETLHRPRPIPEEDQQAIGAALEGRWAEAEQLNRAILEKNPDNVEALNRLGKALTELKQYEAAQAVYERVLQIEPYNRIARKSRERLGQILSAEKRRRRAGGQAAERAQIPPDLFISESGKSAVVLLHGLAAWRLRRQLSRGQVVRLEAAGSMTEVKTEEGVTLGHLEPRIGRRLAEFIGAGNRYAAAIAEADEGGVKVFVRETYQHPRLVGRLSFPPPGAGQADMVRPYIRDLGFHLQDLFEAGLDEEEEEEEGTEEGELGGEDSGFSEEGRFAEEPSEDEEGEEEFGKEMDEEL